MPQMMLPPAEEGGAYVSDALASLHAIRSAAHAEAVQKIERAADGMEAPWRSMLPHELNPLLEPRGEGKGVCWPVPRPFTTE